MIAKGKSGKLEREICIMNYDEEMLREVEMEDKNESEVPILFLKTRKNHMEKSLFDEIVEANLATKQCMKCPDEIAESVRGDRKRKKCCLIRNQKSLKVGLSKNGNLGQYISLKKLIQVATFVVKMTRILLKYNDLVFCSFSIDSDPNKFDDMKPILGHIAQNLGKVLRKYGGQNCGQLTRVFNEETDIEGEKCAPEDRLNRVFKHMEKVKENLPENVKLAQSEFISGLKIFVKMLENYPFDYFYENRLVILPRENAQIGPVSSGVLKILNFVRNLHLIPLKIANLTKNIPKNFIISGAVALAVVAVGLYFI